MKIPITMSHGTDNPNGDNPLTPQHFDQLISIARELGFESIDYDELVAWRDGSAGLPERPIMFDFDHPLSSIRHVIHPVLANYGYTGNLFINTGFMDPTTRWSAPESGEPLYMTWDEIKELVDFGWHIGAHTVSHPNLSKLALDDPDGKLIRAELVECDETIEEHLGTRPKDFAFTGTSWSSIAEREVKQRYRFGRLWIVGFQYEADGRDVRYADLVGVSGPDESDGGPPFAARYITEDTNPYRLPSIEINNLIFESGAFRMYLQDALAEV